MRVVQLIDSLTAGGAERMAVNYANELSNCVQFSGLVSTRLKGDLFNQVSKKVNYLCLNKKQTIDFKALFLFKKYLKENKVAIVHVHSTSFFFAFLIKFFLPKIKLVWHDHYGDSEFLNKRSTFLLKTTMLFYSGIIVVNQKLKNWAESKLNFKNVIYLPNFPINEIIVHQNTILNGVKGKRIVCLANLRAQKNHYLLINVAQKLKESYSEWTFHLVGKDFHDDYSKSIKNLIISKDLSNNVFLYDSKQDISNILSQSDIAILTSNSEGLPLALLEYGLNKKAVVVTNVGEMPSIIKNNQNGFIVESNSDFDFYESVLKLIESKDLRNKFGISLYDLIIENFSKESVLDQYINWINNTFKFNSK